MNRDIFIKNLTGDRIEMSPKGRCANELSVEEFEKGKEERTLGFYYCRPQGV